MRQLVRGCLATAYTSRYRGTLSIGRECEIPFRSLRAQVRTLSIGDYVRFGERVFLQGDSHTFGDHFYCGSDVRISGEGSRFEVGKFSSFGHHVEFILGQGRHRPQSVSNAAFGYLPQFDDPEWARYLDGASTPEPVCRVGHDVWIGVGSVILPHVTIGDGAVIAAESVVREPVPPYAIVGGNPAQVVTFRFKQSLIHELLELKWWDWPIEKINRHKAFFTRNLSTSLTLDRRLLAVEHSA